MIRIETGIEDEARKDDEVRIGVKVAVEVETRRGVEVKKGEGAGTVAENEGTRAGHRKDHTNVASVKVQSGNLRCHLYLQLLT